MTNTESAHAVEAQVQPALPIDLNEQLAKAGFAAFKARFHDRRVGFAGIKESQAASLKILEQERGKLKYWVENDYISAGQAAAANNVVDKMVVALEELAKQERRMVRNDTRFLKTFVQTLGRSLKASAPQLLVEGFGLPPLGARITGSIIQGENPATAALDALITKIKGGELVTPSKEPFEDLLAQVDALQEATTALRGADKVQLLGDLFGVRQRIVEISGLPIPEQSGELDKLRKVFEEAEGTIGELGKIVNGGGPKYAGADPDRFAKNPQWQQITEGMIELGESPGVKIKGAVIAGMSLSALEKVRAELIARGIDPDAEDLNELAAKVIHERILAQKNKEPITIEEAVQKVLGADEPGGSGGPAPTALPTAPPTAVPTTGETPRTGETPPTAGAACAGPRTDPLPWIFEGPGRAQERYEGDFKPGSLLVIDAPLDARVTLNPDCSATAELIRYETTAYGCVTGVTSQVPHRVPLVITYSGSHDGSTLRLTRDSNADHHLTGDFSTTSLSGEFVLMNNGPYGHEHCGPEHTYSAWQEWSFIDIPRATR